MKTVTIGILKARLLSNAVNRINNGEYTERGLARILGISQSHTHNVLKGARKLNSALADQMLAKFGITALDLLEEAELQDALDAKSLPRFSMLSSPPRRMPASSKLRMGRTETLLSQKTG